VQPFRKSAIHSRRDRWLVPYSDFVTLLFAVFAVLYTVERSGKYTTRQVVDSMMGMKPVEAAKVVELPKPPEPPPPPPQETPKPAPESPESALVKTLREALGDQIAIGNASIRNESRGIVISLGQAAFFRSGQPEIDPACYPIIDKIAKVIRDMPNAIRLEGHTDNVPVTRNSRFKSNWELSAARSIAALELLVSRYDIPRDRLSIAGFADTEPLHSNEDAAGRASNRRVDLVIMNKSTSPEI